MSAKKERTCRRCGCTEKRACPGGCSWFADDLDICTRCIEPLEATLFCELAENITAAENGLDEARSDLRHAKGQLAIFTRILERVKP